MINSLAAGMLQIPRCSVDISAPLFSTLPMALGDFLAFRPLGWTSPPTHVFPAKHSNFALALPGETPPQRAVYAPGEFWLTEVNSTEYVGLNKTGYGITFSPCREFKSYFGHLSGLSEKILTASKAGNVRCNPPYQTGNTTVNTCRTELVFRVTPGELIGYSGDAAGVDFGAIDYRVPPLGFANPVHYMKEMLHYVSPVPYFAPEVRAALESKLASYDGTRPRTAEPKYGEYMQDLPGTAQGNWFTPGVSLAIPFQQPDPWLALVHEYIDAAQPIFSAGNSIKELRAGVYGFKPETSGKINRDFSQVKADGAVYCYDSFLTGKSLGGIGMGSARGIVLLAMPTESTLRVEKQGTEGSRCDASASYSLTADAMLFER